MSLFTAGSIVGGMLFASYLSKAVGTKTGGDALQSRIKGVFWRGIKNWKVQIDVYFEHTNPTNTPLTFNYMLLDIYAGNNKLAQIREQNMDKTIKANGSTPTRVRVQAPIQNVGKSILSVIQKGILPDKVLIKGHIKVNDFKSEFNQEYPLQKK